MVATVDEAAARSVLELRPGIDVEAFDAGLSSIAILGTVSDKMIYTTGVNTYADTATTSYGILCSICRGGRTEAAKRRTIDMASSLGNRIY